MELVFLGRHKFALLLLFLLLLTGFNSIRNWMYPGGSYSQGVLLCDISVGDEIAFRRGDTVDFYFVFDESIEIEGKLYDKRVVSRSGLKQTFKPDGGASADLECKRLLASRDRFVEPGRLTGGVGDLCYDGQRKNDFPVTTGLIPASSVDGADDADDMLQRVEVRRVDGTVEYREMARCYQPPEPDRQTKLTLQESAQQWVDDWLQQHPFPRSLRNRGIPGGQVDVYLEAHNNDRQEFVCHGRESKPTPLEFAVCGILDDGVEQIARNIEREEYPFQKRKVIIQLRDPELQMDVPDNNPSVGGAE